MLLITLSTSRFLVNFFMLSFEDWHQPLKISENGCVAKLNGSHTDRAPIKDLIPNSESKLTGVKKS